MVDTIYFATSNPHKVREAKRILTDFDVQQYEVDLIEISDENLETIAKTALEEVPNSFAEPIFVEDSGLFIKALDGFPGFISGYVYEKLGNERILKLLENVDDRSAYFESVVALKLPLGDIETFTGRVQGEITTKERGKHGFDYDPIFQPNGSDLTLAEMDTVEKNAYSHRGRALMDLDSYLPQ